jgi:hypothetical protein
VNVTNIAVHRRNRFPIRSFSVINNVTNFTNLKSVNVTSVNSFGSPFNGVGRSSPFSSTATEKKNKRKKTVKAVAVRGKDKDVKSSEPVVKDDVKNVDLGKTDLSEEIKSDEKDLKVNAVKKKKKKKPVRSKKKDDVKISPAVSDSVEVVGKVEVSKKPSSKGKKTNSKVSI